MYRVLFEVQKSRIVRRGVSRTRTAMGTFHGLLFSASSPETGQSPLSVLLATPAATAVTAAPCRATFTVVCAGGTFRGLKCQGRVSEVGFATYIRATNFYSIAYFSCCSRHAIVMQCIQTNIIYLSVVLSDI